VLYKIFHPLKWLPATICLKEKLTGELIDYYNYTCGQNDVIRSMMLISPDKGLKELQHEKQLLKILHFNGGDQ